MCQPGKAVPGFQGDKRRDFYSGTNSLTARAAKTVSRVPNGTRIYAVGDIHGRADLLAQLFSRIDADLAAHHIERSIHVFLGDYVDRGPGSREVLDRLIDRAYSHESVFLMGNHELIFLQFLHDPALLKQWRQYGGLDTLMSYGLKVPFNANAEQLAALSASLESVMPAEHCRFLEELKPSFECGSFFFAHAGVRPGVPLENQRMDDLLWIREEFLQYEGGFGKIVVHGHTPAPEPEVRVNRINIDTGAYATGRLTCLILEADQRWFI
jgi:serine/threonine protein phosphatase 1